MPYKRVLLTEQQSQATNEKLKPMVEYLEKMTQRLVELKADDADPLLRSTIAAHQALRELSASVLASVRNR